MSGRNQTSFRTKSSGSYNSQMESLRRKISILEIWGCCRTWMKSKCLQLWSICSTWWANIILVQQVCPWTNGLEESWRNGPKMPHRISFAPKTLWPKSRCSFHLKMRWKRLWRGQVSARLHTSMPVGQTFWFFNFSLECVQVRPSLRFVQCTVQRFRRWTWPFCIPASFAPPCRPWLAVEKN